MKIASAGFLSSILAIALICSIAGSPLVARAATITISGNLTSNDTWTNNNIYVLTNTTHTINSGVTITVNSGTVVKFNGSSSVLAVSGVLNAQGTSSPVYFTSYKDDICSTGTSTGCDSNGDNGATSPAAGNWASITVNSTGSTTLNNAIARYGGGFTGPTLYNNGGILNVFGSVVATSTSSGVYTTAGTTTIADSSKLTNNTNFGTYIDGGAMTISSSTFAYNNYGAYGLGGNLTLTKNTFSNNTTAAAEALFSGFPVLTLSNSGNKAYDNGVNGTVVDGFLYQTQTWPWDEMAYVVGDSSQSDGLTIESGKTLDVAPGAVFKFRNSSSYIDTYGTLNVQSNNASTSVFTSIKDDLVSNSFDTNNDGTSTSPAAGDWSQITVESGGNLILNTSIVRYGGKTLFDYSTDGMLENMGGSITVSSSTIASSASSGIYSGNSSAATNGYKLDLTLNDAGIYVSRGTMTATSSQIHDNTSYGIYNNNSFVAVTATNNYWGHSASGDGAPSTTTPKTKGDLISGNITYSPWTHEHDSHYLLNDSSVDGGEIRWDGLTKYADQWYLAIGTWNALGKVDIATDTIFTISDLTVTDVDDSDVAWKGQTHPEIDNGTMQLNTYYLDHDTNAQIQNTITHEMGHALGLNHSFSGNVMVLYQTSQTTLGYQDCIDYQDLYGTSTSSCP
jgi:hypothetical protein